MKILKKAAALIAAVTVAAGAIPVFAETVTVLGTPQELYSGITATDEGIGVSLDGTNKTITFTGNDGWVSLPSGGQPNPITLDTKAAEYRLSFEYKGSWTQSKTGKAAGLYLEKLTVNTDDTAVNMNQTVVKSESIVDTGEEWTTYTVDIDCDPNDLGNKGESLTLRIAFRYTTGEVQIRNLKITPCVEQTVVAKIGDTSYTSLDEALKACEGKNDQTINLIEDAYIEGGEYYSTKNHPTKIIGETTGGGRKTITVKTNKDVISWDGIYFENIDIVQDTAIAATASIAAAKRSGDIFSLINSSVKNMNLTNYLSGFTAVKTDSSEITGNNVGGYLFTVDMDSSITSSAITGNTVNNGAAIKLAGSNAYTLTVTDSQIRNTAASDIEIANPNAAVILSGNTSVGKLNAANGTLKLAEDFKGAVNIKGKSTDVGTVIAEAADGADISGITVDGLDAEKYELTVNAEKQLVIAEKPGEPVNPAAKLEQADWTYTGSEYTAEGNSITDGTETVYGYKAELSAWTTGTYTKAKLTAKNQATGEIRTPEKELKNITIEAGGGAIFYIISNAELDTAASSITLE